MNLVQKTQQYLDAIAQDQFNIVLSTNPQALEKAEVIQQKIDNGSAGTMAGYVVAVKACICVEGLATNCASKTLEGWTAPYTSDAVRMLEEQDALVIAIVNMDEFASGASGETSAYGPTKNPQAPDRVAGGSSSGSAAAVAAKFCDVALGTDTGGSIRNPASHCGVVGIKPSYGRVSRYGLIDLSMSLDQIGPLASNVSDAAKVLQVIGQPSPNDATMRDDVVQNLTDVATDGGLRIGVSQELCAMCDDKIHALYEQALQKYEQHFSQPATPVTLQGVDLAVQAYYPIVFNEFFSGTRKFDGRRFGVKIEDACGPEVRRRIEGGRLISHAEHDAKYYKKALTVKKLIAKQMEAAFENVDVIVTPTVPSLPHKLGEEVDIHTMYGYDALTAPANLAANCAGVVPMGQVDGVPVGLQIMTKAGAEDTLIKAMLQFESIL